MKVIRTKNYNEMSEKASGIILKEISKKPTLSIAFATGKTPIGLYKNLVKDYEKGNVKSLSNNRGK
jgi:glucosamine-6-phosphate deaminase